MKKKYYRNFFLQYPFLISDENMNERFVKDFRKYHKVFKNINYHE